MRIEPCDTDPVSHTDINAMATRNALVSPNVTKAADDTGGNSYCMVISDSAAPDHRQLWPSKVVRDPPNAAYTQR